MNAITLKKKLSLVDWDLGIALLGSWQLGWSVLARSLYNREVDFDALNKPTEISANRASPGKWTHLGSCNRPLNIPNRVR